MSISFWIFSVSTGSSNDQEYQIGLQRDRHREDRKGDTEDPIGGNDSDFNDIFHLYGKF